MTRVIEPESKTFRAPRGRPPLGETERQRILGATAAVFLEEGFQRANTNEIARRARTSKQTLYALFPTKADLFVSVMSAHTERLFTRHAYYIESSESPRRALTEIGRTVLGMFANPEFLALYRIVIAETHRFPDLARQLRRQCLERGYGLLAEYLCSRRIGSPNYRKAAERFLSLVLGDFILNALLDPGFEPNKRGLRTRVDSAVEDFLRLHPARSPKATVEARH
jgi:AcrR family transcriptional regulator